ncbi:MAG TPA: fructose-bisphosphatase class II, partial [Caulobacteraceae bacterium]|nr:fructose-bisphosphatase class II [Caulobacteraceae bacterium]
MSSKTLDRGLVLDAVRVTEAAAIAAWALVGRGDEKAADQAAVEAMRNALNELDLDGTVVIGEGERDEAPMLYIGEQVGNPAAATQVDIAVDPLEGTNLVATGSANATAVLAAAEPGGLM